MALNLCVNSENGVLKEVIIGNPYNYGKIPNPPICERQKRFFGVNAPLKEKVVEDFEKFRQVLIDNGVKVYEAKALDDVPDQLTPRDIGFVLDDTLLISNMVKEPRKQEWRGIEHIIELIDPKKVIDVPENVFIEGGDIIYDRGEIYVGIGQRTNMQGFFFLKNTFPKHKFNPIFLKTPNQEEDVLHLDCTFMPVGNEHVLIYRDGFHGLPESVQKKYFSILVSKEEQQELGTNILSLAPNKVISRNKSSYVNRVLEGLGIEVIKLDFDEFTKNGGSFRCASLPLYRM
ncbi:hypothetical protein HZA97_00255 [Candidatus Woesearchaeota archaeon]|nr:hypothetical protein [Candidatus Woesearchaeota archaeon]